MTLAPMARSDRSRGSDKLWERRRFPTPLRTNGSSFLVADIVNKMWHSESELVRTSQCLDWKEQCSAASYAACCMKLPMVEVFLCSDENYATSTLSELMLVVQRNLYEIVRQHFRDS